MSYRLVRQKSGAQAVQDTASGETMHPVQGPWQEANGLYVAGSGLAGVLSSGEGEAVVFDVGLGAAANALAALTCHRGLQGGPRPPRPLRLVSFESDPQAARFACEEAAALRYPQGFESALDELLATGRTLPAQGVTWELRLGDFVRLIHEEPLRADVVFYDPFSPASNPAMWSVRTLEGVCRCRRPGGLTTLVTYSAAFSVRAALLLAGFFVGEGPQLSPHRHTTLAATWFSALERPLNPGWLARWRQEHRPWPPETPPTAHRRLREALLEHPQWSQFDRPGGREPGPAPGRVPGRAGGGRREGRGKPDGAGKSAPRRPGRRRREP